MEFSTSLLNSKVRSGLSCPVGYREGGEYENSQEAVVREPSLWVRVPVFGGINYRGVKGTSAKSSDTSTEGFCGMGCDKISSRRCFQKMEAYQGVRRGFLQVSAARRWVQIARENHSI